MPDMLNESLVGPTSLPSLVASEGEAWCVCHTKPRCEKKFRRLLEAEGIAHYLPLVRRIKHYERETRCNTLPLFPGYVFVRVAEERRARLYQQALLVRIIATPDESHLLTQLRDVQRVLDSGFEINLQPPLLRGAFVKVNCGPLRGLEGRVDDPENPQAIVIAVDVLQQGLRVKIPGAHLDVIDA